MSTPASRWRLFAAAPLSEAAAGELWQRLAGLRDRYRSARWTVPEQLHLTLVFLGATEVARVDWLRGRVRESSSTWHSFSAAVRSAGGRPDDRRSGVAWLTLGAGRREVAQMALDLDEALGSGVYTNSRPLPHLTVARRVTQDLLDDLRSVAADLRFEWAIDRVVLYRSHTSPNGSRYEELESVPLPQQRR